ncbi:MAG: hypothetical protein ACKPCM_00575 [Pseudanabaena sp.]
MTKYLLDTNVVLRLSNPSDAQHELNPKDFSGISGITVVLPTAVS